MGNWPGITVELLSGKILLGGDMVEIIDLPGIYDLHGFSDDEQVVRHFLHDNVPDLALVILNTTQIERQISLLLQLKQLNINLVVVLNMADEAKKFGISVDSGEDVRIAGIADLPAQREIRQRLSGSDAGGHQSAALSHAGHGGKPAQPARTGPAYRNGDGARARTYRAGTRPAVGQAYRKTGQRDAASLAGTADLFRA